MKFSTWILILWNLRHFLLSSDSFFDGRAIYENSGDFPYIISVYFNKITVLSFRLKWNHKEAVYPETVLSILKALLAESVPLERLVLIDDGIAKLPDWNPPPDFADFIVDFASKMVNLSCFCITFNQMDAELMNGIKQRVIEEVVAKRRSLWFHLGRAIPKASDVGVPSIHYHQIVEPIRLFSQ